MDAPEHFRGYPPDPLRRFVDELGVFSELKKFDVHRKLFYPNCRMENFSWQFVIVQQNFAAGDDGSITEDCFFTLGKEGRPNQRENFSWRFVIVQQNFAAGDDGSITEDCFFTLGKEVRPNQRSICRPIRIIAQCVRRYENFSDDNEAVCLIVDKLLLTNRTFFGGPHDWATVIEILSLNTTASRQEPIQS
jgi:hypothetical protein